MLGIMSVYAAIQLLVPVPGHGAGVLTPEGCINGYLDRLLLPGRLYGTVFDPEGNSGQLAPSERLVVDLIHRAIFEKLEATFYLYQHGYIEPELWEQRRLWAEGFLSLPVPREWWVGEARQAVYGPAFTAALRGGASADLRAPGVRPSTLDKDGQA